MSLVTRKPVFGVCDQVRLKLDYSADETSYGLEISAIASSCILLSTQRTTKALIRLRGCAGRSASLLFAYGKGRFCNDVGHTCFIFILSDASVIEFCLTKQLHISLLSVFMMRESFKLQ